MYIKCLSNCSQQKWLKTVPTGPWISFILSKAFQMYTPVYQTDKWIFICLSFSHLIDHDIYVWIIPQFILRKLEAHLRSKGWKNGDIPLAGWTLGTLSCLNLFLRIIRFKKINRLCSDSLRHHSITIAASSHSEL